MKGSYLLGSSCSAEGFCAAKMSGKSGSDCNTGSKAIPTRRIVLNDPSQMPSDYSSTPGGTLFSTTPGGIGQWQCFL